MNPLAMTSSNLPVNLHVTQRISKLMRADKCENKSYSFCEGKR
jgi:hypothetical protein